MSRVDVVVVRQECRTHGIQILVAAVASGLCWEEIGIDGCAVARQRCAVSRAEVHPGRHNHRLVDGHAEVVVSVGQPGLEEGGRGEKAHARRAERDRAAVRDGAQALGVVRIEHLLLGHHVCRVGSVNEGHGAPVLAVRLAVVQGVVVVRDVPDVVDAVVLGPHPVGLEHHGVVRHLEREEGGGGHLPGVRRHDGAKVLSVVDDALGRPDQALIQGLPDGGERVGSRVSELVVVVPVAGCLLQVQLEELPTLCPKPVSAHPVVDQGLQPLRAELSVRTASQRELIRSQRPAIEQILHSGEYGEGRSGKGHVRGLGLGCIQIANPLLDAVTSSRLMVLVPPSGIVMGLHSASSAPA